MKITDMTAYSTPAATDVVPVVDIANNTTKKVQLQNILPNAVVKNAMLSTTAGEIGGVLDTYTPTLTNYTLGSGTKTGKYRRIGKKVDLFVKVTYNASTVGGLIGISLPVQASSDFSDGDIIPVRVQAYDLSATTYYDGYAVLANTRNRIDIYIVNAAGTYTARTATSSTVPMTWATSDTLTVMGSYEGA